VNEFEKQLEQWKAREKAGPGGGPVGPGGYTPEELRAGISTPAQELPPEILPMPKPIEPPVEIETALHAAWLETQILYQTGRVLLIHAATSRHHIGVLSGRDDPRHTAAACEQ
jgi:hypothetical protein